MKIQPNVSLSLCSLFFLISWSCQSQKSVYDKLPKLKELIYSDKYPNIDGILVARNNKVLVEEYYNDNARDSLHQTRSSHKSITSLLAGIAVDQGLFEVKDEINKYITEW